MLVTGTPADAAPDPPNRFLFFLESGIDASRRGDRRSALDWLGKALAEARRLEPDNRLAHGLVRVRIAGILVLEGRCADAAGVANQAIADVRAVSGAQALRVPQDVEDGDLGARFALAAAQHCAGDYEVEAETLRAALGRAVDVYGRRPTEYEPARLSILLARLNLILDRQAEAVAILLRLVGPGQRPPENEELAEEARELLAQLRR